MGKLSHYPLLTLCIFSTWQYIENMNEHFLSVPELLFQEFDFAYYHNNQKYVGLNTFYAKSDKFHKIYPCDPAQFCWQTEVDLR